MRKSCDSRLIEEWTYEQDYRIVDLETTSQKVFAVTIPASCYKESGGTKTPHRLLVFKDQIKDWPGIFDAGTWQQINKPTKENRKRKGRK